MSNSLPPHISAREDLHSWKEKLKENFYETDNSFQHSLKMLIPKKFEELHPKLSNYAGLVFDKLEQLVNENDLFIKIY